MGIYAFLAFLGGESGVFLTDFVCRVLVFRISSFRELDCLSNHVRLTANPSSHPAVPLGMYLTSGSRVRLPIRMTRL